MQYTYDRSTRALSFSSPVNYSEDLASVMKKMILVSEVAYLAKSLRSTSERVVPHNFQSMQEELHSSNEGQLSPLSRGVRSDTRSDPPVDGYLSPLEVIDNEEMKVQMSSNIEIKDMLGEWEEPELCGDVYNVSGLVPKFVARCSSRTITIIVKHTSYTGRSDNNIDPPFSKSARLYWP
jgi:hypothetical protein